VDRNATIVCIAMVNLILAKRNFSVAMSFDCDGMFAKVMYFILTTRLLFVATFSTHIYCIDDYSHIYIWQCFQLIINSLFFTSTIFFVNFEPLGLLDFSVLHHRSPWGAYVICQLNWGDCLFSDHWSNPKLTSLV
jgi:hypothetical protein